MNLWAERALGITNKFDQRALINNAFYLTMISVNSFDTSEQTPTY